MYTNVVIRLSNHNIYSVMQGGDTVCQRNQDAQTLALIGHTEAATKLMCSDTTISSFLSSSECTGTSAD